MISRDEAFAQGFRLAWRNIHLIILAFVLGFGCASALGSLWEQIEIANVVQRAVQ